MIFEGCFKATFFILQPFEASREAIDMKKILNHLFENKTFSRAEAQRILTAIARGEFNTSQIAAFITAYGMRNITVEELQGFRDAMLDLCIKLDFSDFELVDLCGTGGDGKDTFN